MRRIARAILPVVVVACGYHASIKDVWFHSSHVRPHQYPAQLVLESNVPVHADTTAQAELVDLLVGDWADHMDDRPPSYRLSHHFLPLWNESSYYWFCDKDADRWKWQSKQHPMSSPLSLKKEFCSKFHSQRFLFVGDSVTGQAFTSFAHVLGYQDGSSKLFIEPPLLPTCGSCSHEIAMEAVTCDGTLNVTFIRNEYLSLESSHSVQNTTTPPDGKRWLLDWRPYAQKADVIVLNTGRHHRRRLSLEAQSGLDAIHWIRNHSTTADVFFWSTKIEVPHETNVQEHSRGTNITDTPLCTANLTGLPHELSSIANKCAFQKSSFSNLVTYLDFSCLDLKNSDNCGYKDPAHSCMPGPIDEKTRILLQTILGSAG